VCGKSSGNLSNLSTICVSAPSIPYPIIASDCGVGVNVCTNLNFSIDPNGQGANIAEIPASGSIGNPYYDGFSTFNPWGTINYGCLQIDESNSTWMKVNISGSGNLEFVFGGNNSQTGYYDWIMYPATANCTDVLAHTTAPVRCNWNLVDYGGTGLSGTIPSGGDAGNFEPILAVSAGEVYIICFSNFSSVQTLVPLEFGGTASVSCTPLPVEFLTMSAAVENEMDSKVNLTWSTVSESNNDYFDVERRIKNGAYESIGEIEGNGTTIELSQYLFEDEYAFAGEINYYRIKQVNFDGAFEYSKEVSVMVPRIGSSTIFPNPNIGLFSIRLASNVQGDVTVVLRDISGRIVSSHNSKAINGNVKSNSLNVPSGSYLIEVIQNEIIKTQARVVLSN
ncbi:MAG: T9SS type A sorting domain-containing protein, partial [Crocinitomicaceae bacterium]|nr:T9SS type A sorting domain-containing protein [Crocinitomicaceae bacterium]